VPNDKKLSLREWLDDTPWGNTRGGLAVRLAGPALATWGVIIFFALDIDFGSLFLLAVAAVLGVLFYVLPWVVQRYTSSPARISRLVDGITVFSSLACTLVVIFIISTIGTLHIPVLIAGVQTLWILVALVVPAIRPAASQD